MNNEEKIPEQIEPVAEAPTAEETAKPSEKKMSKGLLIGIIAGAACVLVAVIILIALLAGGNGGSSCDHVDKDDDNLCDLCGESFSDGDEEQEPELPGATVAFTVVMDDGTVLPNVKFTLTKNETVYTLTTGADGTISEKVLLATYAVEVDSSTLPEYCYAETYGVKIEQSTTEATIVIINNRPDGSERKPYPANENSIDITVAPGEKVHFNSHGASLKYLTIESDCLVVNYNGEIYTPVNGVITVALSSADVDTPVIFSVENKGSAEVSTTMKITAPLGSSENPHEITEEHLTAIVAENATVYYSFVADKDGMLVLYSPTVGNSISITRYIQVTTESGSVEQIPVLSGTDGDKSAYIYVAKNDEVKIGVSFIVPGNSETMGDEGVTNKSYRVEFALKVYAGTEADPIPMVDDSITLSLNAGSSFCFSTEEGKTISLNGADVALSCGGSRVEPDGNNNIIATLTDGIFTLSCIGEANSVATVSTVYEQGSIKNPIVITDRASVTAPADSTVYYSFTAAKKGTIVIPPMADGISISVSRNIPLLRYEDGAYNVMTAVNYDVYEVTSAAYCFVSKGDVVTIAVRNNSSEEITAELAPTLYSGNTSNPIPVLEGDISIVVGTKTSFVFKAELDSTVKITAVDGMTVTYNGAALEADTDGIITVDITDDKALTFKVEIDPTQKVMIKLALA